MKAIHLLPGLALLYLMVWQSDGQTTVQSTVPSTIQSLVHLSKQLLFPNSTDQLGISASPQGSLPEVSRCVAGTGPSREDLDTAKEECAWLTNAVNRQRQNELWYPNALREAFGRYGEVFERGYKSDCMFRRLLFTIPSGDTNVATYQDLFSGIPDIQKRERVMEAIEKCNKQPIDPKRFSMPFLSFVIIQRGSYVNLFPEKHADFLACFIPAVVRICLDNDDSP